MEKERLEAQRGGAGLGGVPVSADRVGGAATRLCEMMPAGRLKHDGGRVNVIYLGTHFKFGSDNDERRGRPQECSTRMYLLSFSQSFVNKLLTHFSPKTLVLRCSETTDSITSL